MTARSHNHLMAPVALMLGTACTPDATDIRVRAAFDLKCPKENLEVVKLGEKTRGVRGCGNQATYVYTGGEWLNDAQGKPPAGSHTPPAGGH